MSDNSEDKKSVFGDELYKDDNDNMADNMFSYRREPFYNYGIARHYYLCPKCKKERSFLMDLGIPEIHRIPCPDCQQFEYDLFVKLNPNLFRNEKDYENLPKTDYWELRKETMDALNKTQEDIKKEYKPTFSQYDLYRKITSGQCYPYDDHTVIVSMDPNDYSNPGDYLVSITHNYDYSPWLSVYEYPSMEGTAYDGYDSEVIRVINDACKDMGSTVAYKKYKEEILLHPWKLVYKMSNDSHTWIKMEYSSDEPSVSGNLSKYRIVVIGDVVTIEEIDGKKNKKYDPKFAKFFDEAIYGLTLNVVVDTSEKADIEETKVNIDAPKVDIGVEVEEKCKKLEDKLLKMDDNLVRMVKTIKKLGKVCKEIGELMQ